MPKPSAVFKKTGTKEPPFNFAKAVAEAYAQFPGISGKVFFVDVAAEKLVHPDPALRAQLVGAMNANDAMRADLNLQIDENKRQKASSVMEVARGKHAVYFVLLYLKKDMQSALGSKHAPDENMQLVFDHELAHAVLKQAHGARLLAESTADAYAALRHFQRYGEGSETIEKLSKRRAALGILNQDPDHFTSPALDAVLARKGRTDFNALSVAQTAALAQRLARNACLKDDEIRRLSRHFNKFRGAMHHVKDDAPLRQLARVAETAHAPLLKKWSTVALRAFLDGDIKLKTDKKIVKLNGPYWNGVRKRL